MGTFPVWLGSIILSQISINIWPLNVLYFKKQTTETNWSLVIILSKPLEVSILNAFKTRINTLRWITLPKMV